MDEETHFITIDETTHALVEEKFKLKKAIATHREKALFGVFNSPLTEDETLALKYLYAYMPLNDLADYDSDLFLKHIHDTIRIQNTVPWGKKVPADLFLHFVLPYRVNNENIEDVRGILFEEIYPRVKDMSMEDAILEANHWCHEKANYIGNDRRTVSPLTLIRTAIGRCGEQSTLAVAALRSIGIPARQVYTPLWAHSDSNHAWVEAWADGKWHFFGACEPEPRLNQGWFQNPARRAMLIHTRIGANYNGPEDVTLAHPWYSELNLMPLYAKTKSLKVRVVNQAGSPTKATVHFQLFNFGEFRPLLTMNTDEKGEVDVSFGLGDVYVNAVSDEGWAFCKCDIRETNEITVVLNTNIKKNGVEEFKMVPPASIDETTTVQVTETEKEAHNKRVKEGAEIRARFEATFVTDEDAKKIATAFNLPEQRIAEVLKHARGNSHEIVAYLQEYTPAYGEWALRLLEVLNEKDLTDTFRSTLADHLVNAIKLKQTTLSQLDDDSFANFILRPRVDFEMLTPYRTLFCKALGKEQIKAFLAQPILLVEKLENDFEIISDVNFYQGSATPVGSFKLKKGDKASRDILFVAMARTIGIPARLNPSDRTPQFLKDDIWQNIAFRDQTKLNDIETTKLKIETGKVVWDRARQDDIKIEYSTNFSIARFDAGRYHTLFYKFDEKEQKELELPIGNYRLTTSTRLNDGTALICFRYFEIKAHEDVTVPITFPVDTSDVPVIAKANLNFSVCNANSESMQATETTATDGTSFVWIEPDREPSKHLLREFREMKQEWEALDVKVNCFVSEAKWSLVDPLISASDLPRNVTFFKEKSTYESMTAMGENLSNPAEVGAELPVVYVLDADEQIRHTSVGYKLGISRDIVDIYKQILA